MTYIVTLLSGLLFGAGLVVSGMSSPKKVLDFLDVTAMRTGGWDPTLLMVFIGALPVMFVAYRVMGTTPWVADRYEIPSSGVVDRPLLIGSSLFGIGWGLAGFCPGPAVVALAVASRGALPGVLVFVAAMLAGVWLAVMLRATWTSSSEVPV